MTGKAIEAQIKETAGEQPTVVSSPKINARPSRIVKLIGVLVLGGAI